MEWALHRIVLKNTAQSVRFERNLNLSQFPSECSLLLSMLAYSGASSTAEAENAFARAIAELKLRGMALLPKDQLQLSGLDQALDCLNRVKPLQKPQLLKAMSQCILLDNKVTIIEAELFRAIADSLECPVPPLITDTGY